MNSEYIKNFNKKNNFSKLSNNLKFIKLNDLFFSSFCTKKLNGTRKLILTGNDLFPIIGRRIEDDDIYNLIAFLKKNSDINLLNLAYNCIHCPGFIRLINYLITNDKIIHLNVQNNDISSKGIRSMCSKAAKLKLKILRLNGNKLTPDVCKEVAQMLLQSSIDHLDIAQVDMTTSSLVHFISALRSSTLKIIDLSRPIPEFYNYLDSEYLARIIGSMLKINTSLTELHLQKFHLSCHDIESMLIDAKFNKTLQLIDLGCNNIGDHGVESICNWIRGKPGLSGLILCHNIITDIGARALSFALPFSRIILLDISYNKINDNGIRDILNTIKKTICIKHLRIHGNKIESSAKIIERMLESGVLVQDNFDVKPYKVDGKFYAAHYPADRYKQRYYNVSRYGVPQSNLYDQNPTIFACTEVTAIKPKLTHEKLSYDQDSIEYSEDNKFSNIDNNSSLESQSENNCCNCAPEDKLSSESSSGWYKVKDTKMQSVMLILDKVDYDFKNYILKWINAGDTQPENVFNY